jgi:hypothetical protein
MSQFFGSIWFLLVLFFLLVAVVALLSPFQTLGYWAGWSSNALQRRQAKRRELQENLQAQEKISQEDIPKYFLVFLKGIGVANAELGWRDRNFISLLEEYLSGATVVADIFPFASDSNPLTGERAFSRMYQWMYRLRREKRVGLAATPPVIRNLFQVAVSGDPRYGSIYDLSMAREIGFSLVRQGYSLNSGIPIWLMGWSGAGQIVVGAARYLHRLFQAPVYVISIGGVILDDPAISDIEHLYHLESSRDRYPRIGDYLSPGRWKFFRHSPWNKAREEGRITVIDPGPMRHTGKDDYFDARAKLPNGQTHPERTAEVIAEIVCSVHKEI